MVTNTKAFADMYICVCMYVCTDCVQVCMPPCVRELSAKWKSIYIIKLYCKCYKNVCEKQKKTITTTTKCENKILWKKVLEKKKKNVRGFATEHHLPVHTHTYIHTYVGI
ncbi:unnamed protein product [Ceratitis capitata]|uniref:(Mediterranean fruit fly) hypothetical protein n=1 Tax=Ceratitis capitata TaxID=7213 RepID=A0A811UMK4_CERCA|nr:unnamed protein product [Ceratitis capitata]